MEILKPSMSIMLRKKVSHIRSMRTLHAFDVRNSLLNLWDLGASNFWGKIISNDPLTLGASLKFVGHTGQDIFIHVPSDFVPVIDQLEKWESTV